MISEVIVPDLGATGGDVTLAEWKVKEGDHVTAGTPLFVVETDKATQEVEAFRDGYVRQILVPEGSQLEIGTLVAILSDSADEPLDPAKSTRSSSETRSPPGAVTQEESNRVLAPLIVDGADASTEALLGAFRRMVLIRRYEDHLYNLFLQGQVPGTLHQCQGQEAVAVGVCSALRRDDVVFSTHRPVGHLLAKGASPERITAEIFGKETGCAGGKGGQMHLMDLSVSAMPSNAIVGANIPIATGSALGFKLRGSDQVAVSFFGDGAANIGSFHEGINLAAVKDAPVVFVCENNLYAASTHMSLTTRITDIAERAEGYGIPGRVVDGMDVLAVHRSALEAVQRARSGQGPTLLEYKTYRYRGHSRGDPGNYRTEEEFEAWQDRDPVERFRKQLIAEFNQKPEQLEEIQQQCQKEVEAAVEFALQSREPPGEASLEPVFAERKGGR